MKTCPICGARAFDDAKVCFGCLHRYGEEPPAPPVLPARPAAVPPPSGASSPAAPDTRCPALRRDVPPARPQSRAEQPRGAAGWAVRFELPGYEPMVETDGRDGGLVVRFLPEGAQAMGDARLERAARGTHVRPLPAAGRAPAGAEGRP